MRIRKAVSTLIALIFIAAVTVILSLTGCFKNDIVNWGIFIAAASLTLIAYVQLGALREQANADFLLKFNREFFGTETNQRLIVAIEEKKSILKENGGDFTEYELDDYLGYYELMSRFEKKRLLDFDLIDEMFGHYISLAWRNEEINNYVKALRIETNDPRYYKPFEDLARRVIKLENEVRKVQKRNQISSNENHHSGT